MRYLTHCILTTLFLLAALLIRATTIQKVAPTFWWAGLNNPTLQVLIYGEGLTDCEPSLTTRDITIKETVRLKNPRYLLLYLDISKATPQKFNILLKKGRRTTTVPYELKTRRTDRYAQGFDASDVIYLLMPDRFAQGNPQNTRAKGMLEKTADRTNPDARHGGDLEGLTAHMDYFKQLGVTAIWTTPVLENNMPGGSYHGYAITDYYSVDPRFGGNTAFLKFVDTAHRHGLKIIMDMVFNHCGSENYLFKDMPDTDWFNNGSAFKQTNFETAAPTDIHAAPSVKMNMTDGWFVSVMPDLNQRNRYVADYLIQNSIWWIEYAGIDGIRQDTYPYCDFDMMARWCKELTTQYPRLNIVGETWIENNPLIASWQRNSKLSARNSYLPTVMDFPLMNALQLTGEQPLKAVYDDLTEDIVYTDPLRLLTFLENHDTNRFFRNFQQVSYIDRYKQALTLLLTLRGIPQLYYGTEVLMYGDKSLGDGGMRKDFPGGWQGDTVNAFTGKGMNDLQKEAFDFTTRLLHWRQGKTAISKGDLIHYPVTDDVYVYSRHFENQRITVFINGSNKNKTITLEKYGDALEKSTAADVFANRTITIGKTMGLPPYGIRILEFDNKSQIFKNLQSYEDL